MTCVRFRGGVLCVGAQPTFAIRVRRQLIQFEMHSHLGPHPVDRHGNERRGIGPRHLFWHAISQWAQAGFPMLPDGTCAWADDPDVMDGAVYRGSYKWELVDGGIVRLSRRDHERHVSRLRSESP